MKKRLLASISLLLALSLLLCGCLTVSNGESGEPNEEAGENEVEPDSLHVHKTTTYVYSTAVDESILTTAFSPAFLVLANKNSVLGKDYVPTSLTTLREDVVAEADRENAMMLDETVCGALYAMLLEMEADGVPGIAVTSAYRSYTYQETLFRFYREEEEKTLSVNAYDYFGSEYIYTNYELPGKTGLSPEDALAVVLSYSASPGSSEHQTGLCVDFVSEEYGDRLDVGFENTAAFEWLEQNAYKFGFILRYPKDKTSITGYSYEPWHYRFVGREAATDIYFTGLCLEEYLNELK